MFYTLRHPELGPITGNTRGGTTQYLGIQYAHLDHAFSVPELKSDYEGTINATAFGPSVIAPPGGCDMEFDLIQHTLEKPKLPHMSSTKSLNLNITTPNLTTGASAVGLPVLVFVHGGGFVFGGSWAPHYDMAGLVSLSIQIGTPIIGVTINYRVGPTGFLDSQELHRCGIPPNRALLDQQTAFSWISKHIAGFGGDPQRVTAVGQSAGAALVMLGSELGLFQQVICLGGSPLASPLLSSQVAQEVYRKAIAGLGMDQAMSEERIAYLLRMKPQDLLRKLPLDLTLGPVLESRDIHSFGALRTGRVLSKSMPLMIGSTTFDGGVFEKLGVFAGRDPETLASSFINTVSNAVNPSQQENLKRLLELYGIGSHNRDLEEIRVAILQFATDLKYFATARAYALSWPGESFLFLFSEGNPWEGPHKGRSTHVQDVAFLFQNYIPFMDKEQREVAEDFGRDVIKFACGNAPYLSVKQNGTVRVYDHSFEEKTTPIDGNIGPSAHVRQLWEEIGLDELSRAWDMYFFRT